MEENRDWRRRKEILSTNGWYSSRRSSSISYRVTLSSSWWRNEIIRDFGVDNCNFGYQQSFFFFCPQTQHSISIDILSPPPIHDPLLLDVFLFKFSGLLRFHSYVYVDSKISSFLFTQSDFTVWGAGWIFHNRYLLASWTSTTSAKALLIGILPPTEDHLLSTTHSFYFNPNNLLQWLDEAKVEKVIHPYFILSPICSHSTSYSFNKF